MVISRLHRPLSLTLATLGLITLVACGGGGGGSNPPPVAIDDTTPNAFSFTAAEGAEPNAVITSPAATISGINTATPISISGGEYSIAGGAFTSTAGTIGNGQTLTVRVTASDKTNTAKAVTVTVGGVSATFNVTTLVDITADAFSFTAVTGAELNKEYTSEAITVGGIDVAIPVSVSGGLYSINGGEFTSAAGTVSAGQTITLKATSGNNTDTTQNAVLSVGSISGTFAVTTIPDTTPPVAEFKFPTPYTMSEANTVKVRGTATDDHAIKSVKVVLRSYKLETPETMIETKEIAAVPKSDVDGLKDFSSWTAEIPLTALAENEIKVVATDYRDNEIEIANANKVVIRQADVKSAFPDEVNEFKSPESITIDNNHNQLLVAGENKIWAVNLLTGQRHFLIDHESTCSYAALSGLTIDVKNSRLYGICKGTEISEFNLLDNSFIDKYTIIPNPKSRSFKDLALDRLNGRNRLVLVERVHEYLGESGRVMDFSLDSKEFSVISENSGQPLINGSLGGIVVDEDSYWVTSGGQHTDATLHKVIKVNAITGKREVFADNTTGSGEFFSGLLPNGDTAFLSGIIKYTKNNQIIVMEDVSNKLIAINISSGERTLLKNIAYIGAGDVDVFARDLDFDEQKEILLVTDGLRDAIIMIDIETGEKVIITKSKNGGQ